MKRRELLLVAVQDALDDGDVVLARSLVDAAVRGDHVRPASGGSLCPRCRLDCRWPGPLADHLRNVHGVGEEEAEAA